MIGLFDEIYKENYKYINVVDALYFLVSADGYPVSKIAKFFISNDFHKSVKTYKKNNLDQIELIDIYDEDLWLDNNYWQMTKQILDEALGEFICEKNNVNKESDYKDYFWLKEDIFNFQGFKNLGVKIDNEDYERYLTCKKIDENIQEASPRTTIKEYEKNLMSYWNLRVLPKIFAILDTKVNLLDILIISVNHYTVSYQFLSVFLHRFIYCLEDNLLNDTQNEILLNFIEHYLEPEADKLYRPIDLDDFLGSKFPYRSVCWDIEELGLFFTKHDKEIYQYENTFPKFSMENDNKLYLDEIEKLKKENKALKVELAIKKQKTKEIESKENTTLLSLILDDTVQERYAPDLVTAIKLWKYLYIDTHKSSDSHSNRANSWIKNNTPYKNETAIDAKRLREITSPFKVWQQDRKNKLHK